MINAFNNSRTFLRYLKQHTVEPGILAITNIATYVRMYICIELMNRWLRTIIFTVARNISGNYVSMYIW